MSADEVRIEFTETPLSLEEGFEFLTKFAGPLGVVMPDAFNQLFRQITALDTVPNWHVVKLDTGGSIESFYFKLDVEDVDVYALNLPMNFFVGNVSPDALSIIVTLYMLNTMLWSNQMPERVARYAHNAFYMLRDYAAQHPEAVSIFGAID